MNVFNSKIATGYEAVGLYQPLVLHKELKSQEIRNLTVIIAVYFKQDQSPQVANSAEQSINICSFMLTDWTFAGRRLNLADRQVNYNRLRHFR